MFYILVIDEENIFQSEDPENLILLGRVLEEYAFDTLLEAMKFVVRNFIDTDNMYAISNFKDTKALCKAKDTDNNDRAMLIQEDFSPKGLWYDRYMNILKV